MKSLFITTMIFIGTFAQAEEPNLPLSNFSPEVRLIIRQEAERYEREMGNSGPAQKKIVILHEAKENLEPLRVFGFTERDVLDADGDINGNSACSSDHNHGDLSNRWCHAYFVKLTDTYLRNKGVNKNLSALLSASIFVPKEYVIDKNPSASDLVVAEYEIFNKIQNQNSTRMTITVFGDKAAILTLQKQFK